MDNQGLISGLPFQAQGDTDSLTSQNHNFSSEEVILTELQPVCFQPPVCNLNTSQGGHTANSWPVELNQHHHQLQEEHGPQYNDDADKELDCDYGMSSEIQQCLSLNRDYQVQSFFFLFSLFLKQGTSKFTNHYSNVNQNQCNPTDYY